MRIESGCSVSIIPPGLAPILSQEQRSPGLASPLFPIDYYCLSRLKSLVT